jgi:hypothetical protein
MSEVKGNFRDEIDCTCGFNCSKAFKELCNDVFFMHILFDFFIDFDK